MLSMVEPSLTSLGNCPTLPPRSSQMDEMLDDSSDESLNLDVNTVSRRASTALSRNTSTLHLVDTSAPAELRLTPLDLDVPLDAPRLPAASRQTSIRRKSWVQNAVASLKALVPSPSFQRKRSSLVTPSPSENPSFTGSRGGGDELRVSPPGGGDSPLASSLRHHHRRSAEGSGTQPSQRSTSTTAAEASARRHSTPLPKLIMDPSLPYPMMMGGGDAGAAYPQFGSVRRAASALDPHEGHLDGDEDDDDDFPRPLLRRAQTARRRRMSIPGAPIAAVEPAAREPGVGVIQEGGGGAAAAPLGNPQQQHSRAEPQLGRMSLSRSNSNRAYIIPPPAALLAASQSVTSTATASGAEERERLRQSDLHRDEALRLMKLLGGVAVGGTQLRRGHGESAGLAAPSKGLSDEV